MLLPALCSHPNLQSLDLGDCQIGDEGIQHVCALLVPSEDKESIQDLTLSANHRITSYGWTQLAMAIAANSHLRGLYLDYNHVGDYGAGIFSVAMAANRNIERLDLEGTGITDKGARLLASSLVRYCKRLQELVLAENPISADLIEQIDDSITVVATENGRNSAENNGEDRRAHSISSPRANQLDGLN
jgi:Ran GTPase-activating protein (RanGAP) involved in mRNA processing and transport